MTVYFLTRASSPGASRGQREKVLVSLQPHGKKKTLDELVIDCLKQDYARTFREAPKPEHLKMETARSILYHLIEMGDLIGSEDVHSADLRAQ